MNLPKISVIVPSYNQGDFLEDTLLSIINQSYAECEIIVIDGGSSDNSVDIIKKYEHYLSHWESVADRGQCDALIKGFARASGDVYCWLCSDDQFLPGVLAKVAALFAQDSALELVYGDTEYLYPNGERVLKPRISYHYQTMLRAFNIIAQPSAFFSARVYRQAGGLDGSLHFAMDYDLFLRFGRRVRFVQLFESLSLYRLHRSSKTVALAEKFEAEWWLVRARALGRPIRVWDHALRWLYTLRVVIRFLVERRVVKLGYDRKKYLLSSP
jgi:glycosyltransferase involved in cell wall biosynthesis